MRSNQTCLAQVVVDITRNAHRERSENIFASAVKRQIESQHQQKDSTHFLIATSPDPTPQKKNETDSRAGNFHLKRKIKKEVVAAFKSCISGDKLKMDFDEFDRFVKLAHLVPESESKLCANLIERSFVHAATLDDFDFDMSMMFDKDDEMKRKSKNYSMEKELAPGVSLESAVIFVCMFHGLVPMRDSKESKLIHELRSRNLMSTKVNPPHAAIIRTLIFFCLVGGSMGAEWQEHYRTACSSARATGGHPDPTKDAEERK